MKKIIYIENEIKNSTRVTKIIKKFKDPVIIYIDRYTEVFNKKNQHFKLQKLNPAIILAKKQKSFLLKTPKNYGIGSKHNYYFSFMYNCIFDCRYCFLQGLYNSSNLVIFINYEDFFSKITDLPSNLVNEGITIFSGYDCDSLAYDSITGFADIAIKKFAKLENIELEIRTKSTHINPFKIKAIKNIILAFSFTPERFSLVYEKGVPSLKKRISALETLVGYGWKIGLRLDPFVLYKGWESDYLDLFKLLFKKIPYNQIHSVTYGNIRFPKNIFMNMSKKNLGEELFLKFKKNNNNIYDEHNGEEIHNFCKSHLFNYVDKSKVFCNIHD